MVLFGNQPVEEGKSATFSCTASFGESIAQYIWKLGGAVLSNNTLQYTFVPSRINNGQSLSCGAVTVGGANSQESTLTLQVYCK